MEGTTGDSPGPPASSEQGGAVASAAPQGQLWGLLLPVVTFVGTGIGAIGFIVFFGGFIIWTRYDASGLPANEAVAEVSRNDLIVSGASFLVVDVLAALAAVGTAFVLWDLVIGNRRRSREEAAARETDEASNSLQVLQERAARVRSLISASQKKLDVTRQASIDTPAGGARDAARASFDAAESEHRDLTDELAVLQETSIPQAEARQRQCQLNEKEVAKPPPLDRFLQVLIGGVPMLIAMALVIRGGWGELNWGPRLLLVGVSAMSICIAVVIVSVTRSFAWFALGVFLGVAVVMAFSTYERTRAETKESPFAATVRGVPVTGFLLAETSDAVYVAKPARKATKAFALDHSDITVVRIPKSLLDAFTFGPLMKETRAYRRSLQMALALCEVPSSAAPSGAKAATRTARATDHSKGAGSRVAAQPSLTCSHPTIASLRTQLARL